MNEIICPNCNKAFKIDESGYADILKQVRNSEFEKQKIDFYNFVNEYEKRRGMNCVEYYPELNQFINNIKNENKI